MPESPEQKYHSDLTILAYRVSFLPWQEECCVTELKELSEFICILHVTSHRPHVSRFRLNTKHYKRVITRIMSSVHITLVRSWSMYLGHWYWYYPVLYLEYGEPLEAMRGLIVSRPAPAPSLSLVFGPLRALYVLNDHAPSPAPAQDLVTLSPGARTQTKALKRHTEQVESRPCAPVIIGPEVTAIFSICPPGRSLGSSPWKTSR